MAFSWNPNNFQTTASPPFWFKLPSRPSTKPKESESERDQWALESFIIDSDGDLWLQLAGGKILVSRKVFCLSSKAFNAMLGSSRFGESANPILANDGIQVVSLPEDDYESMRVVAHIIHLQSDLVPRNLPIQQIYNIANLCDKYDLRQCLGPWPGLWIKPYGMTPPDGNWSEYLLVATTFRQSELFTAVTQNLILNASLDSSGELTTDNVFTFNEAIPTTVLENVKQDRAKLIQSLLGLAHRQIGSLFASKRARVCQLKGSEGKCDITNLGCLMMEFQDLYIPLTQSALSSGPATALAGKFRKISGYGQSFTDQQGNNHGACDLGPRLSREALTLIQEVKGHQLGPP